MQILDSLAWMRSLQDAARDVVRSTVLWRTTLSSRAPAVFVITAAIMGEVRLIWRPKSHTRTSFRRLAASLEGCLLL